MGKALLLIAASAMLAAQPVWAGNVETRAFAVFRNGEPIGHHRVEIERDGDAARVTVDIRLQVTALGVLTLYRYAHRAEESWDGGRLISLASETDNDGTQEWLQARATEQGLAVQGTRFTGTLPSDTMPSSYWHPDFTHRKTIMDSQNGRVLKLEVRPQSLEMASAARDEIPARRYLLSGDIDLSLWYDRFGSWVKAAFKGTDGSFIEYRLQ